MNENKLKRLFPHASKTFIERNKDTDPSSGSPDKSEPVAREEMGQAQRSETLGEKYNLIHLDVVTMAERGKKWDPDNTRFGAKNILDALINLGFSKDDRYITSEVTQAPPGMDAPNINL